MHQYAEREKLVYKSPKAGRIYKTASLGMKKVMKLGADKLPIKGGKRDAFLLLTKRYKKIHGNYLKMNRQIFLDNRV